RCPSRPSLAAPRRSGAVVQRSPPSPVPPASAVRRRRLSGSFDSQPQLIHEIGAREKRQSVLVVDLMEEFLVPDAESIAGARQHHVATELSVLAELRRNEQAILRVEPYVLCRADVP